MHRINEIKSEDLINTWIYPKDIDLAVEFIEKEIKYLANIIIYGAGTHTLALFDKLSNRTKGKIKIILDLFPDAKHFKVPVVHPKELKQNNLNFDKIVLSHYDSEDSMKQYLISIGIEEKDILPIYTNLDYHSMAEKKYKWIDNIEFDKDNKNIITFVSLRNNLKILPNEGIRLLREIGGYKIINLNMSRDFSKAEGIYDYEFDCKRSINLLFKLIEKLSPDVIYVHDEIDTLYFLPKVIKKNYPNIKVIWEPYDLLKLSNYPKWKKSKTWSDKEFQFIKENERYNLENMDGIIYKEIGNPARNVYHVGRKGPSLYFNQYLPEKLISFCEVRYKEPYKLVYAGNVFLTNKADISSSYFQNELEKILIQGMHIDLYLNIDEDTIKTMYQDYTSLENCYENVKIYPRVELGELIKLISKRYHFGSLLSYFDYGNSDFDRKCCSTVFAGKLWAYIFAGLPAIIVKDLNGMSDFIERNGIGVSYDKDELLFDVLQKIKPDEYYEMKNNVSRLADKFCMEKMIHKMDDFIKKVLDTYDQ